MPSTRAIKRREIQEKKLGRKVRDKFPAALPAVPQDVNSVRVPYAKRYELSFDAGEAVAWLMDRPEWERTIGAMCDEVEAERPTKGPQPAYDTRVLEGALFYQVMVGIRTWKHARKELAGDTGGRSRRALHFNVSRVNYCPNMPDRLEGVPSESTMCRHRKRCPWTRRLDAYKRYFYELRYLNAQDPVLREGLRILGIDGTEQPTSLTCPKVNKDTGEVVNATRVTCPEGGYRVKDDAKTHGFAATPLHCINALPWTYWHGVINTDEREAALVALKDFRDNVLPHTGRRGLSVLTADTNFHEMGELRPLMLSMGIVPNIHHVSHAEDRPSTEAEKAEAALLEFDIKNKPDWYADGFRELHRRCGHEVHRYRRVEKHGERAVVRMEAECKVCKSSITITAGQWRLVKDTSRLKKGPDGKKDPRGGQKFVKWHSKTDPESERDWYFGNPLSYHDELAAQYGDKRFGHGEGLNGACVKRFKLFKTKAYLESAARAELHCVMVFCAQHGLTQRRRELEATGEFRLTIPKKQRVAQAEADALAASGLALALAA